MPSDRPIEDLLRPSLTEAHDLAGFDRPWDPRYLWVAMLMCGMAGGGALLALNFRRLGMRARAGAVFALFLGLQIGLLAVVVRFRTDGVLPRDDADLRRAIRFGGNVLAVLLAVPFIRAQTRRFRIYAMGNQPPARLLGPGIVAAVANAVLVTALVFLLMGPLGARPR